MRGKKRTKNNKLVDMFKIVSLFSGCGGKDLGFLGGFNFLGKHYERNPFKVVWANDISERACLTYKENLGNHIQCGDIWKININNIPQADIVTGGFPCQDFSVAGLRKGFSTNRGLLYLAMKKVIDSIKPKVFVAENVKGLMSMDHGKALEKIKNDFAESGYIVKAKLVHAADYGVSQTRQRVFIVGIRNDLKIDFQFPEPTHGPNGQMFLKSWIPVMEVIGDLENTPEGNSPNHYWSKAKRYPGTQGNINISLNKPGPTMRAEHHGNIEFHYNGKRRLSAREAARIQSFPDDFIFYKSTSDAYRQIGNAVPPVMAWHIARSVGRLLNRHSSNS